MSTRPIIFDDAEHAAALKRVDALMDAKPGTPDGDELDRLVTQIREYEDRPHGSTRCPICGSWDVHQHDAQAVLKHRQRAIHKAATSTEIDLLREDRDYFKAAYSRKLDDERKALEVGLAVLEEHERFKRTVAFGEREYLKAHGGSYGVCKYKSALEQAMGVEKRLHEKSREAMSGFEREHAYCLDVLRMILAESK